MSHVRRFKCRFTVYKAGNVPFFVIPTRAHVCAEAGSEFSITVIGNEKRPRMTPDTRSDVYVCVDHFSIFEKFFRAGRLVATAAAGHLRDVHDILLTCRISTRPVVFRNWTSRKRFRGGSRERISKQTRRTLIMNKNCYRDDAIQDRLVSFSL